MSDAPDFQVQDPRGQRDSAIPRFYVSAQRNNFRSEQEGRPCFDDVEKVEILIPGDRHATWDGRVTQVHKDRWPREYEAFKKGLEPAEGGTPLDQLPGMTASQVEELKYMHVRTVEALAGLSDDQCRKAISMGGMALRDKAKRWLDSTSADAATARL